MLCCLLAALTLAAARFRAFALAALAGAGAAGLTVFHVAGPAMGDMDYETIAARALCSGAAIPQRS